MRFDERVWYQQFKCPKCGYESHVTDVCRHCVMMPANQGAIRPVYCYTHKTFHTDNEGKPMMHDSVVMVKTEWALRFNPNLERTERRKVKNLPEGAILR